MVKRCGVAIIVSLILAGFALAGGRGVSQSSTSSTVVLSFEDRVAYQRAIEEIYWRHRIWPKENPDPKPPLSEVMPNTAIRQKVEDTLLKSRLLDEHWQRPITAEQLQAEMDRMTKQTRQPDMLRELFEALGNDPYVIAECLARPSLADRLIHNWYAYDERIHGELRAKARAELGRVVAGLETSAISGEWREEVLKVQGTVRSSESLAMRAGQEVELSPGDFQERLREMARLFPHASESRELNHGAANGAEALASGLPVNRFSELAETPEGFRAVVVREVASDRVWVVTLEWPKQAVDAWLRAQRNGSEGGSSRLPALAAQGTLAASLRLPAVLVAPNAAADTWSPTDMGAPTVRGCARSVWTGSEMIVWGGRQRNNAAPYYTPLGTGARYDPATDTWTDTNTTNAPMNRSYHVMVWTGSEVVVWGGSAGSGEYDAGYEGLNSGGRYNPTRDSWTPVSTTHAPRGAELSSAVWTGAEMIVWGGMTDYVPLAEGGRYNPTTDTWRAVTRTGAPIARYGHSGVWTGSQMIIWGGDNREGGVGRSGGRYNPASDTWSPTSTTNAPGDRRDHIAVWTGSEMVVWGGPLFYAETTGGLYDPIGDTWRPTSTANAPSGRPDVAGWTGGELLVVTREGDARYNPQTDKWSPMSHVNRPNLGYYPTGVWTGHELIAWGGQEVGAPFGGRYDPASDTWIPTSERCATPRSSHSAVWTGSEMLLWAGLGSYDPALGRWSFASEGDQPQGTSGHTAVWTGREMIVWGGIGLTSSGPAYFATGGRYNPATRRWTAVSTQVVPRPRGGHTVVWTGQEMVVWGGFNPQDRLLGNGGRYNPLSDSWKDLPIAGSPSARTDHTAVWTGSDMIVWGGDTNTGGKYNRASDTWTALSTTNAPSARTGNTAVWTGSDMIIWGGVAGAAMAADGGRYSPTPDSWLPTALATAPTARTRHTAVWTGKEMIVWGGDDLTNYFNTGGRYDPSANTWSPTTTIAAPGGRKNHTAVWTGKEMIVWGGNDGTNDLDTGGRYFVGLPAGAPTASFTISPQSPTAGKSVQLTDTSTGTPTSWTWTFGDGSTSTEQSPSHTYSAAGQYAIHLVVTNASGTDTAAVLITVRPAGQALADLSVTLSALPNPVETGKDLTYLSTVTNNGPDGASAVVFSDTLPTGVTFVSATASQGSCNNATGVVTCNFGAVANGVTATVTTVVRPTATGSLSNTVTVSSGSSDSNSANNSATASVAVVAPGTTYTYLVPSIAHWPGQNNTAWRSDVSVVNRSGSTAHVTFAYYTGTKGMNKQVTDTIGSGATKRWTDILVTGFGLAQAGLDKGTMVVTTDVPMAIISRTYNQTAAGTFGQHYPALKATDGITAGQIGILPHLSGNNGMTGYRTNVGVVNLGTSVSCSAIVKLFNSNGTQIGLPVTITADAQRFKQQDSIFIAAGLGSQSIDVAYGTIEVQTPNCRMWAYASVVDNASSDPTTIEVLVP